MPVEPEERETAKKRKKNQRVRLTANEYYQINKANQEFYDPVYSLGDDRSLRTDWGEKKKLMDLAEERFEEMKEKDSISKEDKAETPPEPASLWSVRTDAAQFNWQVNRARLTQAQTSFIWALLAFIKERNFELLFHAQADYIAELTTALSDCECNEGLLVEVSEGQQAHIIALTNALEAAEVLYQN